MIGWLIGSNDFGRSKPYWLMIDWLIYWLINWLIDWLIDWVIYWLIDWLIGWLLDWSWHCSGQDCTDDYIIVSGGGATAGASTNYDRWQSYWNNIYFCNSSIYMSIWWNRWINERFCGGTLALSSTITAATIYTNKLPFSVGLKNKNKHRFLKNKYKHRFLT